MELSESTRKQIDLVRSQYKIKSEKGNILLDQIARCLEIIQSCEKCMHEDSQKGVLTMEGIVKIPYGFTRDKHGFTKPHIGINTLKINQAMLKDFLKDLKSEGAIEKSITSGRKNLSSYQKKAG